MTSCRGEEGVNLSIGSDYKEALSTKRQYGIPRVAIGEYETLPGGETYLMQRGVEVVVID